MSYVSREIHMR